MYVRQPGISTPDNAASDPSARPGHPRSDPALQRRPYVANDSNSGPAGAASVPEDVRIKAGKEAQLLKEYARSRNRAVWAQALVLFNVVGLPLSQGVYVAYYYTGALPNRNLTAVSIISAFQVACLLATPAFAGVLYHWRGRRSGWRILFFITVLAGVGAQLALQWTKSYASIVILQGLVLGGALGTLFAISTLVLGSHYNFNLPLVSMQSGFMGFAGALVYTAIARQGLGARAHKISAPAATAGIILATLCTAQLLIRRVEIDDASPQAKISLAATSYPKGLSKIFKELGTSLFVIGDVLIFFGLFVFPTYIIAIVNQPPALVTPELGTLVLLTMYSTAAISACLSANSSFRKRLGPVNTFIAASLLASAASIIPTSMPSLAATLICGGVYGIGFGAVFALHIKVSTVFHHEQVVWHPDMPARAALVMALCGASAMGGLTSSAYMIESLKNGVKLVTYMAAGSMLLGGLLIVVARWRRRGKFYVAI